MSSHRLKVDRKPDLSVMCSQLPVWKLKVVIPSPSQAWPFQMFPVTNMSFRAFPGPKVLESGTREHDEECQTTPNSVKPSKLLDKLLKQTATETS